MAEQYFVTGTDTGIGKTTVAALLCAALNAMYWKPIQTGVHGRDDAASDRLTVMRLAGIPASRTIPENFIFKPPVSPHLAAQRAGVRIDLRATKLPRIAVDKNLIVEGAGGVLVPINKKETMADLMRRLKLPVLLVARTALGTINHTLLSVAALRAARLKVHGVIMVGPRDRLENRAAIEHYGGVRVVGYLPWLKKLDRGTLLNAFRTNFDQKAFNIRAKTR
jgi:dethiobiotin synthetase